MQQATGVAPAVVSTGNRSREPLLVAAVLATTLLAYAGTLRYQFVLDDNAFIVTNPEVQHARYIPSYFTGQMLRHQSPHGASNYYRPGFMLWCLLNVALFGLRPMAWHATTILLHLVVTALVYLLARKLLKKAWLAGIAALFFGVHPIHVEAVAWVCGGSEPVYTIPLLASFVAYLESRECGVKWMVVSLALFAVALLCKETAIVLPGLIFFHAWFYWDAEKGATSGFGRAVLTTLPFAPIVLAYVGARWAVLHGLSHAVVPLPPSTLAWTAPRVLWFYLHHLVFPLGLAEYYDLRYVTSWAPSVLPALVVLAVVVAVWYWGERAKSPVIKFAGVWIALPILPFIDVGLFQTADIAHDRYLYLPSIGFALLLALGVEWLGGREWHGVPSRALAAIVVLTVLFCADTAYQSIFWADEVALFSRSVAISPHNPIAKTLLGNTLLQQGKVAEAQALYREVLAEEPKFLSAALQLGYVEYKNGNYAEAERIMERLTQEDASNSDEWFYLGLSRFRQGRVLEGEANVRHAIALNGEGRWYHYSLGFILKQRGDCAGAIPEFQKELSLYPDARQAAEQLAACQSAGR